MGVGGGGGGDKINCAPDKNLCTAAGYMCGFKFNKRTFPSCTVVRLPAVPSFNSAH